MLEISFSQRTLKSFFRSRGSSVERKLLLFPQTGGGKQNVDGFVASFSHACVVSTSLNSRFWGKGGVSEAERKLCLFS